MGPLRVESVRGTEGPRYFEGGHSFEAAKAAGGRWSRGFISRGFLFPTEMFVRSWPLCLIVVSLGMLCLIADLGRPDRILTFVFTPRLSVMTVGAFSLAASLLIALIFSVVTAFDGLDFVPVAVYALGFVGVVAGLTCAVYTGVLLSGLVTVLFWQTWMLPAIFMISSLSGGLALVFLSAAFVDVRQSIVRSLSNLARIDGALIVIELVILLSYVAWGVLNDGTSRSAWALAFGDYSGLFWGGVVSIGLVLPFILERFIVHGNRSSQLMWVAAAILLGCFLLRICIVGSGAYDLTQVSPGLSELFTVSSAWRL
ncbi:MAG: polysulfide reductase NrfD [Eggerthellaceae bacterium]|nr:polysulfide reductase NrfD [Eggerthellaceae bacterium]